jgi:hypothetical protein
VKSYVFIDVIKGNRKMPTNAELIKRIICEEFFDYSLGGCYFRRRKYLELKNLEVKVSRFEEPRRRKYLKLKNLEVEVFRVEV